MMNLSDDHVFTLTDLRITCCLTSFGSIPASITNLQVFPLKLGYFDLSSFCFCFGDYGLSFHGSYSSMFLLQIRFLLTFIILTGILAEVARKHLSVFSFSLLISSLSFSK